MVSTRRSRRREPNQLNEVGSHSAEEMKSKSPQKRDQTCENHPQPIVYARLSLKKGRTSDTVNETLSFGRKTLSDEDSDIDKCERSTEDRHVFSMTVPSIDKQNSSANVIHVQSNVYKMETEIQNDLERLKLSEEVSTGFEQNAVRSKLLGALDTSRSTTISYKFTFNEKMAAGTLDGFNHKENDPKQRDTRDNFGWLMQTGKMITTDPLDTIPLTCVRGISDSGVCKLEFVFLRSEDGSGMSMGVSSAAPQPVVVKIPADRLQHVVDYFISVKGLSVENAYAISRSKIWYGIVEGAHRRKALITLGERFPNRFKGYPWVVLCIDWQPLEVLRAFARERKEFQRGEHLVDFTMYDIFKNLKQSADKVAVREGLTEGRSTNRGYLKRVADHYCGGPDTANNLTRQLAGIAVVLSWNVIEEMGALLNREDLDRAWLVAQATGEKRIELVDARVLKNLFTKSTFRGATTFKSLATEDEQISTLRRLRFLAPKRDYKPVSKSELEKQTKRAMAAHRAAEKMETRLGTHAWPADMEAVRENLLTTTTLDAEVEENDGSSDLLPKFKVLWECLFPIAVELDTTKRNRETEDQVSKESSDMKDQSTLNSVEDSQSSSRISSMVNIPMVVMEIRILTEVILPMVTETMKQPSTT